MKDSTNKQARLKIDKRIFRAYDIRGIVKTELSPDIVYLIGKAFATKAVRSSQPEMVVGRDGRLSSSTLRDALVSGLIDAGINVVDVGLVPTPILYYATNKLGLGTGIMITGSHNPPEYNGLKMMIAGNTLAGNEIAELYESIVNGDLLNGSGTAGSLALDIKYEEEIKKDITLERKIKVVVDCGNGAASNIAPRLLEGLGCEVIPLYCKVDGTFPNHHPDPADPNTLKDLKNTVLQHEADIGIAFDGDGDRIGVVTEKGAIIWPDRLMMLFAESIISRHPATPIIYDVKCSRNLEKVIENKGGVAIMCKTGHSHIKAKMKETGALLGGEFSGHICIAERWLPFDDAIYASARLIELLSKKDRTLSDIFTAYPSTLNTPEIKVSTTEDRKFEIIDRLAHAGGFEGGKISTIDGVRVDYEDGWGLIRASNTSPVLTLRFEGENEAALERIKKVFQSRLSNIEPNLTFL